MGWGWGGEHLGPYMPGSWWWWLFPRLRGFWENVRPFISRLCFVFVFVFVFEMEIRSRALIPLFLCQDESTVAQRAETAVAECSLTSSV